MFRLFVILLAIPLLNACKPKPPPPPPEPPVDPVAALREEGQELFTLRCTPCHQIHGQGLPGAYPPLVGSPWLLDEHGKERATKILLYGLTGRIQLKGHTYDAEMPNFKLTDREIAAALTYVRSAWGNQGSPVEESYVAAIRARLGNRGPWTPYELLKLHPVAPEPAP